MNEGDEVVREGCEREAEDDNSEAEGTSREQRAFLVPTHPKQKPKAQPNLPD